MSEPSSRLSDSSNPDYYGNQGIDSEIGRLVKNYQRIKRISGILFALFLICGLAFLLYSFEGAAKNYNDIIIQNKVVCQTDGKVVALAVLKDNKISIVISTDSGKTFNITGGPWPVADSSSNLYITPAGDALLFTNGSADYYTSEAPFNEFKINKLPAAQSGEYKITGSFYSPQTRQFYLYGNMPFILKFSAGSSGSTATIDLPKTANYTVLSFAVSPAGAARIIALNNDAKDTVILASANVSVNNSFRVIEAGSLKDMDNPAAEKAAEPEAGSDSINYNATKK